MANTKTIPQHMACNRASALQPVQPHNLPTQDVAAQCRVIRPECFRFGSFAAACSAWLRERSYADLPSFVYEYTLTLEESCPRPQAILKGFLLLFTARLRITFGKSERCCELITGAVSTHAMAIPVRHKLTTRDTEEKHKGMQASVLSMKSSGTYEGFILQQAQAASNRLEQD